MDFPGLGEGGGGAAVHVLRRVLEGLPGGLSLPRCSASGSLLAGENCVDCLKLNWTFEKGAG